MLETHQYQKLYLRNLNLCKFLYAKIAKQAWGKLSKASIMLTLLKLSVLTNA